MKNKTLRIAAIVILLAGFIPSKAQVKDLGNFMAGGVEDASALFDAYLSPYINGFGASLTGGWFNTAKPHKLGGFDITVTGNVAIVPDQYKTFDVEALGLQTFALAPGESNIAPTIAGESEKGPQLNYNLPEGAPDIAAFQLPQGVNNRYVPSPMLQVGIGLIKGTEIIGRYTPELSSGGLSFDMWGVGLKHSVKQWIPVLSKMPVFHLSVMGGYTQLNSSTQLTVTPSTIGVESYPVASGEGWVSESHWDDQSMDIIVKSFTGNVLVSANLPVICFYGSAGFATTNTELSLLGNYPIFDVNDEEINSLEDPISISIKNQDGGVTKPRFTAGMRLKFAVVTLHFDYTYANYSMATAGLGISFR